MDCFFEVENLTKHFGGLVATNNVSFKIDRREIVGLIGPNGSGKTTLIRLIIGMLKADKGFIRFKGNDIIGRAPWDIVKRGIAITHQIVRPYRDLSVLGNVMIGCLGSGMRRGEWVKRIENAAMDALEFCGIADMAKEKAAILSHGDLTRLEIARAIATEPEFLILDEPFGGLSPYETELMAKSLRRLHKGGRFGRLHNEGPAMMIVEHKLSELMKISDRVIVLNYGEVITVGTPKDVVSNPVVLEAYIGKADENNSIA